MSARADGADPAPLQAPAPKSSRAARRGALACLLVVWLAFVFPAFKGEVHFPVDFVGFNFTGSVPHVTANFADSDGYSAFYPWHVYLGAQLRDGHLPLWDPSRVLGVPYAANPAMATFYPPNWLYALGHPLRIVTLIWAGTLLASLLLTFWFGSVLRLHPWAAALMALAWTFGAFMMSYALLDSYTGSAVWLPMALGGFELARRGRPRSGLPIAGVALALSVLAGHAQITVYVWLATALWAGAATLAAAAGVRAHGRAAMIREVGHGVGLLGGAFGLGVGLSSIQVLGALEYAGQIVRQKESFYSATQVRLLPGQLPTLVLPNYLGNPVDGNFAPTAYVYAETTFYVGLATLPLAVAGLWHRNRRVVVGFLVLLAVGVAAAFGTPLLHLLFTLVPGVARTRSVARFKILIDFALPGLAALGLDAILSRQRPAARAALGACGALGVVLLALAASRWGTTLPGSYVTPGALLGLAMVVMAAAAIAVATRVPARSGIAAVVILGLLGADLWAYGFHFHPFQSPGPVYPTTPEVTYLSRVAGARARYVEVYAIGVPFPLPPDASMVYGLFSLNDYDVFVPADAIGDLTLFQPAVAQAAYGDTVVLGPYGSTQPPMLDLLGINSVVTAATAQAPGTKVFSGRVSVFSQPGAFPPAFLATCWEVNEAAGVAVRLTGISAPDLRSTAVVSTGAAAKALGPSPPTCPAGPAATINHYAAQDVSLSVTSPDRGGIVVLTDQWFPGWEATVDGRPAPILLVDGAVRGVKVGPGTHQVDLTFRPHWPLEGLAVTLLTVVVTAALIVWSRRRPAPGLLSRGPATVPGAAGAPGVWPGSGPG